MGEPIRIDFIQRSDGIAVTTVHAQYRQLPKDEKLKVIMALMEHLIADLEEL